MSVLSIRARFPLGVYIGHQADGTSDAFPDPARLHAALMHAAGTGTTAVENSGDLVPSADSLDALHWLENNPPVGMYLPERRPQSQDSSRFIYRKEGTVNRKKLTNERRVSDGMSISGPVGYRWDNVPDAVATTLRELCADVAVLGETESTVVLDHEDFIPNFEIDTESSMFSPGGYPVRSPEPGRTAALIAAHAKAHPGKYKVQPTTAGEKPQPNPVPTNGLRSVRYRRPDAEAPAAPVPWDQVLLLELDGPEVPAKERMDWCVTLHKAIIRSIGSDIPAMVTGNYPSGMANRPANQLAIQYFTAAQVSRHVASGESLGLLLPRDAAAEDLEQLARGLGKIRKLWSRHGERTVHFTGVSVDGAAFWQAPQDGYRRLWSPSPVAVTENRSPRPSKTGGHRWGLADAGIVSVANVWRNEFDSISGGSDDRLVQLHAAASGRGARVGSARLKPVDTARFVHKSRRGMVPQCWTGLVDLGTLAPPTVIAAIGQSRHVGGGLLEPVDVPEALYDSLMGAPHD